MKALVCLFSLRASCAIFGTHQYLEQLESAAAFYKFSVTGYPVVCVLRLLVLSRLSCYSASLCYATEAPSNNGRFLHSINSD